MSDFEEVKKRYGLRAVNIATWRDPRGSILPARGGPRAPTVSAAEAGRAFTTIPYKVKYKLPEPTDDEDSGEESVDAKAAVAEVNQNTPASVEDLFPKEVQPADESVHGAPEDQTEHINPALEQANDPGTAENPLEPSSEPSLAPEVEETVPVPPPAPSPPPIELSDGESPETVGIPGLTAASEAGDSPAILMLDDPLTVETLVEVPSASKDIQADAIDSISPVDDTEEQVDKKVSFAPGTPEPKPTARKKKGTKSGKSKSKKRVVLPTDDSSDDIVAVIDESSGSSHLVPLELNLGQADNAPLEKEQTSGTSLETPVESLLEIPHAAVNMVEAQSQADSSRKLDAFDNDDNTPLDANEADLPPDQRPLAAEPALEKVEKKKASKTIGREKTKSKKKSLKSKVKEDTLTGLGIDIDSLLLPPPKDMLDRMPDFGPPPGDMTAAEQFPIEYNVANDTQYEELDPVSVKIMSTPEPALLVADNEMLEKRESDIAEHLEAATEIDDQSEDPSPTEPGPEEEGTTDNITPDGSHEEAPPQVETRKDATHDIESANATDVVHEEVENDGPAVEHMETSSGENPDTLDPSMSSPADSAVVIEGDSPKGESRDETSAESSEIDDDKRSLSPEEDHSLEDPNIVKEHDTGHPSDLGTESHEPENESGDNVTADDVKIDPAAVSPDEGTDSKPAAVDQSGADEGRVTDKENGQTIDGEIISGQSSGTIEAEEDATELAADQKESVEKDGPGISASEATDADAIKAEDQDQPKSDSQTVDLHPSEAMSASAEGAMSESAQDIAVADGESAGIEDASQPLPEAEPDAMQPTIIPDGQTSPGETASEPVEAPAGDPAADQTEAVDTAISTDVPQLPSSPPSPTLSKGSHKSRADHWERPTKKPHGDGDKPSQKPSWSSKRSGRETTKDNDTFRKHRSTRRTSMTAEDERRRREVRKAKEDAKLLEAERKRVEDEERRAIRHAARREARRVLAEEEMRRLVREEAEAVAAAAAKRESVRRRRRDLVREEVRPSRIVGEGDRELKSSSGAAPARPLLAKAYTLAAGESVTRTAPLLFRTSDDRKRQQPSSRRTSKRGEVAGLYDSVKADTMGDKTAEVSPLKGEAEQDVPPPASSSGGKSRRRHHSHRSGETDGIRPRSSRRESESRPKSSRRDSERPSRRPVLVEEKSGSFWSSLFR